MASMARLVLALIVLSEAEAGPQKRDVRSVHVAKLILKDCRFGWAICDPVDEPLPPATRVYLSSRRFASSINFCCNLILKFQRSLLYSISSSSLLRMILTLTGNYQPQHLSTSINH